MSKGPKDAKDALVSPETLELLAAVRKGKTCAYVMGYKATAVGYLAIRKKKPQPKDLADARRGGQTAAWGVVKAQAANITFYLARNEGFTELPFEGKIDKIRQFLNEATAELNQKWAPTWLLVDENPPLDLDDALVNHPLVRRFNSLQPIIVGLLDAQPQLSGPVDERTRAIRDLLQDAATIDSAAPLLDALEAQLKLWMAAPSSAPASSTPDKPAAPPLSDADRAASLAAKLKQLKPQLDRSLETQPSLKTELLGAVAGCAGRIKNKEFDAAESEIAALEKRLLGIVASPAAAAAPQDAGLDLRQQWEARRLAVEPNLLSAQRIAPDRAAKLGAVWDYADKQAAAGNFTNANTALDRLEAALQEILAAAPRTEAERHGIDAGIVARRVRELEPLIQQRIAEIAAATSVDVRELGDAIEAETDEDEGDSEDIEQGIQWYLQDMLNEVRDNLLKSLQGGDKKTVEAAIQACQQMVTDDPLMQQLAVTRETFQVEVDVEQQLSRLFQDAQNTVAQWTTAG